MSTAPCEFEHLVEPVVQVKSSFVSQVGSCGVSGKGNTQRLGVELVSQGLAGAGKIFSDIVSSQRGWADARDSHIASDETTISYWSRKPVDSVLEATRYAVVVLRGEDYYEITIPDIVL